MPRQAVVVKCTAQGIAQFVVVVLVPGFSQGYEGKAPFTCSVDACIQSGS